MHHNGYDRAIDLIKRAQSGDGFLASPLEHDNYRRIWTRDGVITGLAALLSQNDELIRTFHKTLCTIFDHQHPLGFIASNVSSDSKTSFGGTVGRADNPSWAVIGLCQYSLFTGDNSLANQYVSQVEKCFHVLDIWEYNGKHLVYVPQSGDWADEYIYHGYLLFDQLLRMWALRLAAKVFSREEWEQKADRIKRVIEINYWNYDKPAGDLYATNLSHQLLLAPKKFWFMGFNPSRIYHQFDLQANALALFLRVGCEEQSNEALGYIDSLWRARHNLLPSFHPAILNSDNDMTELENNFAFRFRNHPHEFHNGGLWPVWNGLMAMALATQGKTPLAAKISEGIHAANELQNWDFNECLHGETGEPIGVRHCTWSAAGAVIADASLNGAKLYQS